MPHQHVSPLCARQLAGLGEGYPPTWALPPCLHACMHAWQMCKLASKLVTSAQLP